MVDDDGASLFEVQLYALSPVGPVRWRLVGPGNRVYGQSGVEYLDVPGCEDAVRDLQRDLLLLHRGSRRIEVDRWTWEVRAPDGGTAVAPQPFGTRNACDLALMAFVLNFPEAGIDRCLHPVTDGQLKLIVTGAE
jgi:hypothetical protein